MLCRHLYNQSKSVKIPISWLEHLLARCMKSEGYWSMLKISRIVCSSPFHLTIQWWKNQFPKLWIHFDHHDFKKSKQIGSWFTEVVLNYYQFHENYLPRSFLLKILYRYTKYPWKLMYTYIFLSINWALENSWPFLTTLNTYLASKPLLLSAMKVASLL